MRKLATTTLSVALAASLTVWGISPALADETATETTQESTAVEATTTEAEAVTTVKVPFTNADCVDKPSSDIVKALEDAGFTNIHKMQVRDLPDNQVDKIDTVAFVDITDDDDSTDDKAFTKNQEFPSDAIVLVGYHKLENCQLNLAFDFHENWIFSTYDVNVYFDGEQLGSLEHGKDGQTQLLVKPGTHTLTVENAEDSSVTGTLELNTTDNTNATIKINCHSNEVTLQGTYETDTTVSDALEEYLPQEMARRAVITAITNCFATDVFAEDGNTYDPEKFHAYSDSGDYSLVIENEGAWQAMNEIYWQVNNIGLQNKNGVYHYVSAQITREDDKYFVTTALDLISANKTDIQKTALAIAENAQAGKKFNADDYQSDTVLVERIKSFEDNPCFVVPLSLIEKDRAETNNADDTTSSTTKETKTKTTSTDRNTDANNKTTQSIEEQQKRGWVQEDGDWYYYDEEYGWKLTNTWVDSKYYVGPDGKMMTNAWVDDDYYVGADGVYVTDTWIDGYYIGSDGRWVPNYEALPYNAVSRNPDNYNGAYVTVSGKVLQVSEGWFGNKLRIAMNGSSDTTVLVKYSSSLINYRILEDDWITVNGTFDGMYTYTALLGNSITIPSMNADSIVLG